MTEIKPGRDELHPRHWLTRAAASWPHRPAILHAHGELDFAGLARRAGALARRMPEGVALALGAACRFDLALGIHAALQRGVAILPLEPGAQAAEIAPWLAACGIGQVFPSSGDPAPASGGLPASRGLALLLPGSGSGGRPRVAMLTPEALRAAVLGSAERLSLRPGDLWLACLSLGHVGGVSILLRGVQAGAGVLLHEDFDAGCVWHDLQRHPVTHISLVPAMLYRLLAVSGDRPPPPGLRAVLVGGAALDPSLARRALDAGWPLCVTYGMSETGSQVATQCGAGAGLRAGRVGRPLPGFELRIAGADAGGPGRIELRGPALMVGYARPGLAPGLGLERGWLRTGDLGRLHSDGELEVIGRADDVLVSGGEQVHPLQVEPVLRSCPGVGEAALSACADPVWGDLLVAVYTGSVDPRTLASHCRARLRGALRPRRFVHCPELPRGRSGKLDRRRLRAWVERELDIAAD